MPDQFFEKNTDGTLSPLTLLGESDGEGGIIPLQISRIGDPAIDSTPLPPTLTGSMSSRTSAVLSWILDQGNRPPVTSWVVERRHSVDNGVSYGDYSPISGSPFSAATMSKTDNGLPVSSGSGTISTLKSPIRGVMTRDMGGYDKRTDETLAGTYSNVNWRDLQPNGQGTAIDKNSSAWADIVSAFDTGLPIAIRINTGVYAPMWAKRLSDSGDAVPITVEMNTSANLSNMYVYSCGRWWTETYKQAWDDFMTVLAGTTYGGYTLDTHPQLRHVCSSPAQTVFVEPMLRQMSTTHGSSLGSDDVWTSSYTYKIGDVVKQRILSGGTAYAAGTTYTLGDIVNIVSSGGSSWSSNKTYNFGDFATSGGVSYYCIADDNLNHSPASSPTWWSTTAWYFSHRVGNVGHNPLTDDGTNWTNWGGYRCIQTNNTNHLPQTSGTWWSTANPNDGLKNSQVYHTAGLPGSTSKNTMTDALDIAAIRHPILLDENSLPHWYNLGWQHTRYYLAFSPVQTFASATPTDTGNDLSWTQKTIKLMSDNMKNLGITANNSWTCPPDIDIEDRQMWTDQQVTLNCWGEQTETQTKLTNDYDSYVSGASWSTILFDVCAVAFGLKDNTTDPTLVGTHNTSTYSTVPGTAVGKYRAHFVELPSGWATALSNTQCVQLNAAAALNGYDNDLQGTGTGVEIVFEYRVAGVNGDGQGEWSNVLPLQYQGTPQAVPERCTDLAASSIAATSVTLTWDFPADATVTKQAIYKGSTLVVDNIDKLAKSYVWSGLVEDVPVANVNVRRMNSTGWSVGSNWITFTPTAPLDFVFAPAIGCSNSNKDHGGTLDWDAWRVYSYGAAKTVANRTGANHPKILGLTDNGNGAGGIVTSYQTTYNFWRDSLDDFYYDGDGSGTRTTPNAVRKDVELHIANGNEYSKDITTGNLSGFIQGCRGIYEATRILNANGTRRYPLASSWLDPTNYQEADSLKGGQPVSVMDSMYPAVPYLDGIAWSMYPPGRNDTFASPTLDWPSFDYDLPRDTTLSINIRNQRGFLVSCFRRTYEAQHSEFNTHITTTHPLKIACWETGTGDFPLSESIRPYYIVHGWLASAAIMAKHYDLEMSEFLYWDQMLYVDGVPQAPNTLSDEPTPGVGQISSRVALQNWSIYNLFDGGTRPSDWPASGPPNTWPNRNNTWKNEWLAAIEAGWPL